MKYGKCFDTHSSSLDEALSGCVPLSLGGVPEEVYNHHGYLPTYPRTTYLTEMKG